MLKELRSLSPGFYIITSYFLFIVMKDNIIKGCPANSGKFEFYLAFLVVLVFFCINIKWLILEIKQILKDE